MHWIWTLIGIAFCGLALIGSSRKSGEPIPWLTMLGVVGISLIFWSKFKAGIDAPLVGVLLSVIVPMLLPALEKWWSDRSEFKLGAEYLIPVGLALIAISGDKMNFAPWFAVLSLALGALIFGSTRSAHAAIWAALIVSANVMSPNSDLVWTQGKLGVGLTVLVTCLSFALSLLGKGKWVAPLVAGIVVAGAYLLLQKIFPGKNSGLTMAFGCAVVVVSNLLAEEGKSALLHKVALLLSVLGATAIFGFGKTSGLVISSLVMFALTLIQGYDLRLLAPTLGLALYRLAKGTITDQGGYELANHYLLSGIIGGAILVLVFDEWQNRERSGWSGVGWLLVLPSMGALIQFALDFRGLVGWLLGSALGIALLPGRKSLAFTALPISAGLLLLIPRLLNDTTTLSRTERMLEGMWWCVPVVLGVAVLMIPKAKKEVLA